MKTAFFSCKLSVSSGVIVSVAVSREINMKHYFLSIHFSQKSQFCFQTALNKYILKWLEKFLRNLQAQYLHGSFSQYLFFFILFISVDTLFFFSIFSLYYHLLSHLPPPHTDTQICTPSHISLRNAINHDEVP